MSDLELIKTYVSKELQAEAITKLNNGYPVQYIIGNVDFYDNIIKVNEDVLIPRFETEYLVDKTIKLLNKMKLTNIKVLEIGTGSGCISIALKKNINCEITAIDISEKAIAVAKENALNNNVDINFIVEDITNYKLDKKFDLIISNPPYVPYDGDVDEKIRFEPQNAIFAEENGLYFYKIILEKVKNNLNDNYLIAFEIGVNQGEFIEKMVKEIMPDSHYVLEKDYNNYDRYVFISNEIY